MKLSFQNLFFSLALVFGLFAAMVLAKAVLIPLSTGLLISFILFPVVKKLEAWGLNTLFSTLLSLLLLFSVFAGAVTLFSTQIMNLSQQLNDFSAKIMNTLTDAVVFINGNVYFIEDINKEEIVEKGKKWINESSGILVKNTFENTAAFFTGLTATVIFAFLFLIYRVGLSDAFIAFGDVDNRTKICRMLKNIQKVGKKYLSGMFLLIVILGFANSIGLWLIGIDSPFLFGFMAAILGIIPYVGTLIGATIPVLYAFMSSDALWVPAAVIILFVIMQFLEGNFLSPQIVGSSLNVNALVAILSLLIGASVWGIAGMILFLPFAAILKVICEEFDQLKPIAMIISSDISGKEKKESMTAKWFEQVKKWFQKN